MNKTIEFELNNFQNVPHELRTNPTVNKPSSQFTVHLSRLYHHYYCDSYGAKPPDPNHLYFEYLRFLAGSTDFRFLGDGPAASEGKKRAISTELGQAFCRYFLYEFCGITYFAHMDKVLEKPTHPAFNGLQIKRLTAGDVPDYLCARSVLQPFIGEAKGRFSNINFNTKEFDDWRAQFTRIGSFDKNGRQKKLKGYIVGTKFTTEQNVPYNKSKLLAEDPETPGEEALSDNEVGIGRGCTSIHYSRLLSKLGLNLLSEALDLGFVVPQELQYNLPVWRCVYPPLEADTFVGGYFSDIEPQFTQLGDNRLIFRPNILRLGIPEPTFYGLKTDVFRQLRAVCLGNWDLLSDLPQLSDTVYRPSNLAWLRDGSITGSLEFFEFTGFETF